MAAGRIGARRKKKADSQVATGVPIIVSERSGAIAVRRRTVSGEWERSLVTPAAVWPVLNPARDAVAVSVVAQEGEFLRSNIELFALDGTHMRTLHQTPRGVGPVIAPRIPHYAAWSPRGDVLSYVAQSSYGLTLFLSEIDGAFVSDPIINGAPIFSAWCPDNNFLGVHAGDELAVIEVEGSRTTANVAERAVGFRTPAFSSDANIMAYAVPAEPGVAIMRAHFQGTGGREVHRLPGGVAMAFRPGTCDLTVALTRQPDSGVFDELWSIDMAGEAAGARLLWRGPLVAFFWAPQGDRMVAIVPTHTGDGRFSAWALDAEGRFAGATEPFVPSVDYRTVLGFFDQFATSHHLWSPDGEGFLLAGRLPGDAVSAAFGDPVGDYVMLWEARRGAPVEVVGPGDVAFFPPPRQ